MPKVHRQKININQLKACPVFIDGAFGVDPDRSGGAHLASLLREIAIRNKLVKWASEEDRRELEEYYDLTEGLYAGHETKIDLTARMLLGVAWEDFIVKHIHAKGSMTWRPGEWELLVQGTNTNRIVPVVGTPDGYSLDVEWYDGSHVDAVVEECKVTWESGAKDPMDSWLRRNQGVGYAEMARCAGLMGDTGYVRYHILRVNGDYESYRIGESYYEIVWVKFNLQEMVGLSRMLGSYL